MDCEKNPQTGRYEHFLPRETKFERQIERLAQDVKARLATVSAAAAQPSRRPIYVAEVSADLLPVRNEIADQLTDWGYRVVPAVPLPIGSPALRAAIKPALAEASLSVHLFSDKRGAIPENEEKSIPALKSAPREFSYGTLHKRKFVYLGASALRGRSGSAS